jgi:hypothetical protein
MNNCAAKFLLTQNDLQCAGNCKLLLKCAGLSMTAASMPELG